MTILRIVNRGLDRGTYEAVRDMLDIERQHPLGLIMHGVIEVDGAMQVTQVWDSEEYAQRFDRESLRPALEAVHAPLDATVRVFDLEHLVTP
jgi:hypothetical protein